MFILLRRLITGIKHYFHPPKPPRRKRPRSPTKKRGTSANRVREPAVLDALKDMPVKKLTLTNRARNILRRNEVHTVSLLLQWCEHQLLLLPGLGRFSLRSIRAGLKEYDLYLNSIPFTWRSPSGFISKCTNCNQGAYAQQRRFARFKKED